MIHKAWCCLGEVPYYFSSFVKFQGHTAKKNRRFWPKLGVPGLQLQFEFTNGYEMMHKVSSGIEEVPYYFQGHLSNFKVTRDKKSPILTQIEIYGLLL